jgi:hypothetical protein
MSLDGVTWVTETNARSAKIWSGCAKKGAVIAQITSDTTAYSFTESGTVFNAPNLLIYTEGPAANTYITQAPYYIKGA